MVCQALISVLLMLEPGHISFVAATARAFRQAGWSRGNWCFCKERGRRVCCVDVSPQQNKDGSVKNGSFQYTLSKKKLKMDELKT